MELIMIRHFPTKGNLERRYIGRTDEPILDNRQIGSATYPPADILAASPLLRCIQTTERIYGRKPDILCPSFREKDFGRFEGKNYEELKTDPAYQRWLDSNGTLPFPEGESQEAFQTRCTEGFEELAERLILCSCKRAALIVHGGTMMALLSYYFDGESSFYDWQAENGNGYRMHLDEAEWTAGRKKLTEIEKLWEHC